MRALKCCLLVSSVLLAAGCAHAPSGGGESPLAPGAHHATVDGLDLAYRVAGQGPVLIAHPGGPGVDGSYLQNDALERHFTVVYLDPMGTGRSGRRDGPTAYTIDRYAADLEALRQSLAVDRVYLLGHSFGGFVVQTYALAHPEHVAGLILYDTSPTIGPEWQKDFETNFAKFANEPWYKDAKAAAEQDPSTIKTDADATQMMVKQEPFFFADYTAKKAQIDPFLATLHAYAGPIVAPGDPKAPPFDVRDKLGSIKVPTLIIVGQKDMACSPKYAEMMHQAIAGSTLVTLPDSGHFGHIEAPQAFAAAIDQYAAALPAERK